MCHAAYQFITDSGSTCATMDSKMKLSEVYKSGPRLDDNTTLYKFFEDCRKKGPITSEVYYMDGGRRSIEEVWTKANEYAKGMLAVGLKRGDNMCTVACVSPETLSFFLAATSIGVGYAHPDMYEPRETSVPGMIPLVSPKLVILGEGKAGHAFDVATRMFKEDPETFSSIKHFYYDQTVNGRSHNLSWIKSLDDLVAAGSAITDEELRAARDLVQPQDTAMHLFSSGSTGKTKCIVHSQFTIANELYSNFPDNLEPLMIPSTNVDELYSYGGLCLAVCGFTTKTVCGPDVDFDRLGTRLKDVADTINQEKVVHYGMTSAYIQGLLQLAKHERYTYPSLKTVMLTGQLFSLQLRQDLAKYFGALPYNAYGLSETFFTAYSCFDDNDDANEERLTESLYTKPNCEFKIVDDDGNTLPIGKEGELWCKCISNLLEYKNAAPGVFEKLMTSDGYVRTGDMAVMNEKGAFFIKGRKQDSIRFNIYGDLVYPGPIENIMASHPAVKEIAVISGGHSDWLGDEIVYCISPNKGHAEITEDELLEHLYKDAIEIGRPCRIIFMEHIPRTDNSRKISKAKLRVIVTEMIEKDPKLGLTKWFKEAAKAQGQSFD